MLIADYQKAQADLLGKIQDEIAKLQPGLPSDSFNAADEAVAVDQQQATQDILDKLVAINAGNSAPATGTESRTTGFVAHVVDIDPGTGHPRGAVNPLTGQPFPLLK